MIRVLPLTQAHLEVALRAAEDDLWAAYQASGIASEAMQGITIEQLRRWAVTHPEGNAAARTLGLLRLEVRAAVGAFLLALPPLFVMPSSPGDPAFAGSGHPKTEAALIAAALAAMPRETQETKSGAE